MGKWPLPLANGVLPQLGMQVRLGRVAPTTGEGHVDHDCHPAAKQVAEEADFHVDDDSGSCTDMGNSGDDDSNDDENNALVGALVAKTFGNNEFRGMVTIYDPHERLFMVRYDDGDSETMTPEDLEVVLGHGRRLRSRRSRSRTYSKGCIEHICRPILPRIHLCSHSY